MTEKNTNLIQINCSINGREFPLSVHPMARLLDVLRYDLELTGTKEGCSEGECGACSIIMNGKLVNSCIIPAIHAKDTTIITIEGVSEGEQLNYIQQAFLERGGAQCGFCTPGMVLAAKSIIDESETVSREHINMEISGNLCRCTGIAKIIDSIESASSTVDASGVKE